MNSPFEKNINEYDLFFDKELTDDQLDEYLVTVAPLIGDIVIIFNSLEDYLNFVIKEMVSDSLVKDEIPWIFISEMSYKGKINVLEKLYNFFLRYSKLKYEKDLQNLIDG